MSDRILLLVCASLFLPLTPLCAQSGSPQKFSVSGRVVNSVTNEAVAKALVAGNEKSVMTDADGRFEISGVSGPSLNLYARRPGFVQENQRGVRTKLDANLENMVLKLVPLSRISGRVLDRDGEPAEGVPVQCMAQLAMNGRRQWQARGGTTTDETGSYAMDELEPGTYIVRTQEKQLYMTQPKSEAARYIYPPTFYPDARTRDLAQHIELAPGSDAKIDISLQPVRGTRVTLITVPAGNVIASIGQEEDQFGGEQARMGKDGELTFPAVPPGTWKIVAHGPFNPHGSGEPPMYGELDVEVGSSDIDNLKLPLNKLVDIPITITGAENAKVFLQLLSKSGMLMTASNQEPNGEWKLRNVQPGTYRVIVPLEGGSSCIASLTSGAQDLFHGELVVSAGTAIQAVAAGDCPQVTVNTNRDEQGMLVITGDRSYEPRLVPANRGGSVIKGLSEGDYKIYAFDNVEDLEYANPDALRDFKFQAVHLEAGQKATVQLEVNERQPK